MFLLTPEFIAVVGLAALAVDLWAAVATESGSVQLHAGRINRAAWILSSVLVVLVISRFVQVLN